MLYRQTLSRDCENGETPRWASQKYNFSIFPALPSSNNSDTTSNSRTQQLISKPYLTAQNKNFTSPSLRSLSPSQLSISDSCTDLTGIYPDQQPHLPPLMLPSTFCPIPAVVERRESKPELIEVPPPRPPRHSKSLGHIPKLLEQDKSLKRRRSTSTCKSTHSLFECSQGCFNVEDNLNPSGQLVTITTGPMVL